jgi:hypothetical protein
MKDDILTLLIPVGRTSAEGKEKSQYREKVFWPNGKVLERLKTCLTRRTGLGSVEYRM